jgi:hypothetical protein
MNARIRINGKNQKLTIQTLSGEFEISFNLKGLQAIFEIVNFLVEKFSVAPEAEDV